LQKFGDFSHGISCGHVQLEDMAKNTKREFNIENWAAMWQAPSKPLDQIDPAFFKRVPWARSINKIARMPSISEGLAKKLMQKNHS